jgi:hypothetical protein
MISSRSLGGIAKITLQCEVHTPKCSIAARSAAMIRIFADYSSVLVSIRTV